MERLVHRETEVVPPERMRAAAEALKGMDRACDITRAKPEFVEFIRACSPASVLVILNQHATLVEQRDRLVAALRQIQTAATNVASYDRALADIKKLAKDALATIEQSSPSTTGDEQGGGEL